jgi:hypothetical protein
MGLMALRARAARIALTMALALAPDLHAQPDAPDVRVDGPWRSVEIRGEDCSASLWLHADGASARYRDDCRDGPAQSAARLDAALTAMRGHDGGLPDLQSLDCGRLAELPAAASRRLAEAAARDGTWEQAWRGRAAGAEGWANRWVSAAITRDAVLGEYAQVLARHGLRVNGAGVEKVLIGAAGRQAGLEGIPVPAGTALPWDAIVWLRLQHAGEPRAE